MNKLTADIDREFRERLSAAMASFRAPKRGRKKSQSLVYRLECDGSCEPINPGGKVSVGVVVKKGKAVVQEIAKRLDSIIPEMSSNNVAEFEAVSHGLEYLISIGATDCRVEIVTDSKFVVDHTNLGWRISDSKRYGIFAERCRDLLSRFKNYKLSWIPREKNTHADRLSKKYVKASVYRGKRVGNGLNRTLGEVLGVQDYGDYRASKDGPMLAETGTPGVRVWCSVGTVGGISNETED